MIFFSSVEMKKGERKMKRILASLLVAVIALSLLAPINAWFHPGNPPSDDFMHNQFGPMSEHLLCRVYGSQLQEYADYLACEVDIMDWVLTPGQAAGLTGLDPDMLTYARAFYVEHGMREFDINNMRFPTNDVYFRRALAHCFDKDTFIAAALGGLALKMDSPLACLSPVWYNDYCTNLYPYNLQQAADILDAAGYVDSTADGWREGPAGEPINLILYAPLNDPDRVAMAAALNTELTVNLAAIGPTFAGISVTLVVATKAICEATVMTPPFNYHLYTGHWRFGRDPTFLYELYRSDTAQAYSCTANYPGYQNALFDANGIAFLNAPNVVLAISYILEMQKILMDDAGVIPVFTYASYGAYKSHLQKVVNTAGVGPWGWFTFMNAYRSGYDTINWGFMNDIESLNVMHSKWVWDWQMLDKIYDTLIKTDPYDPSRDEPWMAKSWELGEWEYEGDTCTKITFKLREDMYWQDVPPLATRENPDHELFLTGGVTNVKVTAYDVDFSIDYTKSDDTNWNYDAVENVVYCDPEDPYTVTVYFDSYMPLWALHKIGELPIVPKHIWENVDIEDSRAFDPIAQRCLQGCGPWVYNYYTSVPHTYYMLDAYHRYFRYHPIDVNGLISTPLKRVDPCNDVTISFWLHNQDFQRIIPSSQFTVTITKKYPDLHEEILFIGSNPLPLPPCEEFLIFEYTGHIDIGLYEFKATITPDPLTGHTDQDGYTIYIWGTIKEDLNLDFFVNAKDTFIIGWAYGSYPGHPRWIPNADLNGDYIVNYLDLRQVCRWFGWPDDVMGGWLDDIAVTDVTAVSIGQLVHINVTVENEGEYLTGFDVDVYANSTKIGASTVWILHPDASLTLPFTWDSTDVEFDLYEIWANATIYPWESDPDDNTFVDGIIPAGNRIHDVAITDVRLSHNYIYQGENVTIHVDAWNRGSFSETFNVTACADQNLTIIGDEITIGTQSLALPSKGSTTLTFTWNVTGMSGNYTISAIAANVTQDADPTDNLYINGKIEIFVSLPCHDINIYSPIYINLNPSIFQFDGNLGALKVSLGNMTIESTGYEGALRVLGSTNGIVHLRIDQPNLEYANYYLPQSGSIKVPLWLLFDPGTYSGTYELQLTICGVHKLKITVNIVNIWVCQNGAYNVAGGTVTFSYTLTGGSWVYLEALPELPAGWSFTVDPPIGTLFETPHEIIVNVTAALDAEEGDIGSVTLRAYKNETNILIWQYIFFASVDSKPPTIEAIQLPELTFNGDLLFNATVKDTSGIESVQLYYSVNEGEWNNKTMQWHAGDTFNSTSYTATMPHVPDNSTVKYYIVATDWLKNQTQSDIQTIVVKYDLAITEVKTSKTVVGQGFTNQINVTIANQGTIPNTSLKIIIYADTTPIYTQTTPFLANGTSTNISFDWNTTGIPKGEYKITIFALPILGETGTADNTYCEGVIRVTMMGDCAAEYGIVDIFDLVYVALSFGAERGKSPPPGTQPYAPNADLNGDNIIDIFDIVTIALHYGETDP
jgi:ABC-type transport system substrate-binding protein